MKRYFRILFNLLILFALIAPIGGLAISNFQTVGEATVFLPMIFKDPDADANHAPYAPSNPMPADDAVDQSVDVSLSWQGGDPDGDTVTYDIYFAADDETPDVLISEDQTSTTFDPGTLDYNTHYYWQVVATDEHGESHAGPVWDFTTGEAPNQPPNAPSNPSPVDGATDTSILVELTWQGGDPDDDSVTYDVYLEADDDTPDMLVAEGQSGTIYFTAELTSEVHYYWQVIAMDEYGLSTNGPVWDFTTGTYDIHDLWQEVGVGSAADKGVSNTINLSENPSIAITTDGIPYITWCYNTSGNYEIYVRRWSGTSWDEIGANSASNGGISSNTGRSTDPKIAIAPNGTPYITWTDELNTKIYVRRWNGVIWEEVGTGSASGDGINGSSGGSTHPSIAFTPDGMPYIAWEESGLYHSQIYVRRWNGASWEEVGTGSATGTGISNTDYDSVSPSIAITPDGTPFIAWEDYTDSDNEIYVRRWNGSSWEEVGDYSASGPGISYNSGTSSEPSIDIGPDGTPYVSWHDYSSGTYQIYVRRWNGTSWEEVGSSSATDGGVSASEDWSGFSSINIAPDNTPYVFWNEPSTDPMQVFGRRWNGTSWEEIGTGSASNGGISNSTLASYRLSSAIAPDGTPYLTWYGHQSELFSDTEIYTRRYMGEANRNMPPYIPKEPQPADEAIGQNIEVDLSWWSGDAYSYDVTYDIYFEADDATPDILVSDNQTSTIFDPGTLNTLTTYFWQVVATNSQGITTTGPVWSFTTRSIPNLAPEAPANPLPADGTPDLTLPVILNWTATEPDGDEMTYDVYLEADDDSPDELVSAGQSASSYNPVILDPGTHYYWQIVVTDQYGLSTTGPVWDFTTGTGIHFAWQEVGADSATEDGISNTSQDSTYPAIAIAPDGTPYITWVEGTGWNSDIYVRRWNGIAWEEVGEGSASDGGVNYNAGPVSQPAIAFAPDGTPHITWATFKDDGYEIYVRRWNGATWEEVGAGSASNGGISDSSGACYDPSIAISGDGDVYIAWEDYNSGDDEIHVRRWNGTTWEEIGSGSASGGGISNNTGDSRVPSIAISTTGTPYITWVDNSSGNYEIYVRRWNGTNWEEVGSGSATGTGISNTANASAPSIAIATDGTPYITWQDASSGDDEIYIRRWNGVTWEQVGSGSATNGGISNTSGSSQAPTIAIASDNTPYITWCDDTSGNMEIYVLRYNGVAWEEVDTGSATGGGISMNNSSSYFPVIAISSDGTPYVSWTDQTETDTRQIYVRRYIGE